MSVHLVRHGQARFDLEDYDQLSDLGRRQSALLGQWLALIGQPRGRIWCGGLQRHRQTAEACLAAWGQGAIERCDPRFDEFDHREVVARFRPDLGAPGALNGFLAAADQPHRAFQRLFADSVARWVEGRHDDDYSESWTQFRARCVAGLRDAVQDAPGDVWIFSSGGPIAAILQHYLGTDDRTGIELSWSIMNGSVTKLSRGSRLLSFNSIGHLECAADQSLLTYR